MGSFLTFRMFSRFLLWMLLPLLASAMVREKRLYGCQSCQHLSSLAQLEKQSCCCNQDVVWWNQQFRMFSRFLLWMLLPLLASAMVREKRLDGCQSCQHLSSLAQLEKQSCCCNQDVVWW